MTDCAPSLCPRVDAARLRHQRVPRGVLLYHVATDATFETNETGLDILHTLDGSHTCREIAEHLAASYAQPVEAMLGDVSEFVLALARHGFLEST